MFAVRITKMAEKDVAAAIDYLLAQGAEEAAAALWADFEAAFTALRTLPLRGHTPPELAEYPDKRIREVHARNYRIIYRIAQQDVFILFVADARRNITEELVDRALRFGN